MAGNSGQSDPDNPAPGNEDTIIATAALNEDGNVAWFSISGNHVELAAPGKDVPTTDFNGLTTLVSGTSFAAPHVTATIALMKSLRNDLDVVIK